MSEPVDWYENRHDLLCEQVFRCHDGTLVRLNRTVPGDGTRWYVDDWDGSSWAMYDSTIEPGDLGELVPDPEQAIANSFSTSKLPGISRTNASSGE